ncbi:growth-regulating factor 1-like isoform X1 [Asparagus officinalis]|uniref:growth-regulating factor 1-like isoform X1 n=1 Tax=Asparagus officinalis TaxID=4686 RepID=UPI00098E6791|nr:growth-regulating factor 1-like isoform X1 [Asparagus officinalis]
MIMDFSRIRQPFTTSQRQELELQALIFNYMASGIPIPSHLILPFRRNFSLQPISLHHSSKVSSPPSLKKVSYGRRVEEDPEPWRCKRTDGKKWRCSREASGDSKYCERHKHRGKKCFTKNPAMPLFTSSSACSSCSSFTPRPLALSSRPAEEEVKEEGEEHCFVFGADLRSKEAKRSPKVQLSLFGDERGDCASTELSISICRS